MSGSNGGRSIRQFMQTWRDSRTGTHHSGALGACHVPGFRVRTAGSKRTGGGPARARAVKFSAVNQSSGPNFSAANTEDGSPDHLPQTLERRRRHARGASRSLKRRTDGSRASSSVDPPRRPGSRTCTPTRAGSLTKPRRSLGPQRAPRRRSLSRRTSGVAVAARGSQQAFRASRLSTISLRSGEGLG